MRFTTTKGLENMVKEVRALESKLAQVQEQVGEVTRQSSETWHDNAPYDEVVRDVKFYDTRLQAAIERMRGLQILEYPLSVTDKVVYGSRVKTTVNGRQEDFRIVGYGDDDFENNRITHDTPIAKALMGRKAGSRFRTTINGTIFQIEIHEVLPLDPHN